MIATVPSLNTENELMSWGRRVIEGEEFRIRKGGSPITNPTIAVVKVRFGNFIEAWTYHNDLAKKTLAFFDKNEALRKEADEIILQLWNEVEKSHNSLPEENRKEISEKYGLVYFYRKSELGKIQVCRKHKASPGLNQYLSISLFPQLHVSFKFIPEIE